jgi:diadenosine tetraphosphate (Ap4A) HIT family hydrolase
MLGETSERICKRKQSYVWNVQLYSSAENEKETVHILCKAEYGNEIGNPEFNLHVHNIPRQKENAPFF